jgi:UPF0042 nucleotide-binding protein
MSRARAASKTSRAVKPRKTRQSSPRMSPQVVIVTGMSGAGKSTALHALEDAGFETVDNLPVALLHAVVAAGGGTQRPLAVGIDVRTRDFDAAQLLAAREAMRQHARLQINIVFLDCDNEILGQRYTETRRPHPLADDLPVSVGVETERRLLAPLREHCDLMIDTSRLAPGDMRRILLGQFGHETQRRMQVFLMSFAYRNGLPRDADLVLDVRFLKNPHYVPGLRHKTGLDRQVGAYIAEDPALQTFLDRATAMLEPLLPLYAHEGKSYLTIAVGCTGGQHRSVYVVERLRSWLSGRDVNFDVRHRDLPATRPAPRQTARKG